MTSECSPIIRVCRKRSADPHSALVVQLKRQKADPLLFSLFKTCDTPEPEFPEKSSSKKVIDFSSNNDTHSNDIEIDNPLAFANNSINEVGGPEPELRNDDQIITVNGQPMVSNRPTADFVFDFYKISRGFISKDVEDITDLDMRFATKEEENLLCLDDNSESENGCLDDDEDSNDEGNWRNDYPEEESDDELDHGNETGDVDFGNLRLQMQRFGFNDEEYDVDDDCDLDNDYDVLDNDEVDHIYDDDDDDDDDDCDGDEFGAH